MLTQKDLKDIITYDPKTGIIAWLDDFFNNPSNTHNGYVNEKGYLLLKIGDTVYRQHRLAWLYITGEWPKNQIDHKNNIKHDNRWDNLREADNQLNHYNLNKPKNNTSGAKGVRKLKNGKFQARIKYNQKEIYIGTYNTLELASEAYFTKSKELAGEFANKGHKEPNYGIRLT